MSGQTCLVHQILFGVNGEIAKARYNICKGCSSFSELTKICKECGCFMPVKTKFKNNKCPLDKWDIEETHEQK